MLTNATVLAALEQLCRAEFAHRHSPLHLMTSDETAANWGPYAPMISRAVGKATGELAPSYEQTRRALARLVKAGAVLRASPHSRVVRFWPVGLWERLQAENVARLVAASAD